MTYKESIKKMFWNSEKLNYFRFKAWVFLFVFVNFLFFLDYFFVGAGFYYDFTLALLPHLYILLLVSYLSLFFFSFLYKFPNFSKWVYFSLFVVLVIFSVAFSFLVIFPKETILNFLK
jgi:hypothetical protein